MRRGQSWGDNANRLYRKNAKTGSATVGRTGAYTELEEIKRAER